MMHTTRKYQISAFLLILSIALPVHVNGQEEEPAPAPAPQTTANPEIPVDHLDLMLDPLTKDELLVEAEAWRDLVKAKAEKISSGEIEARTKNAEIIDGKKETPADEVADPTPAETEKTSLQDDLVKLRDQRTALVERLNTVLNAYEMKGGDPQEFRKYAAAVSAIKVDATDTSAVMKAVTGWLTSEEGGIKWGMRLLQFLAIMVGFWIIAGLVGKVVRKFTDSSDAMSELHERFLNKIIRNLILFIGLLVAISTLGVNVSALLALVGGGAFILGFALQESLGNFAAGVMLLIYRPFDAGDVVEIGGTTGIVDSVSLVSTTIHKFDNTRVIVPNGQVWGQVISNITANETRRVDLVFGCGYDDDIDKARDILKKIVSEHELVLDDPEPLIEIKELADSSVNFLCNSWVEKANYGRVMWDITERVKKEFDAAGLSIPYPQRDVHLYKVEEDNN